MRIGVAWPTVRPLVAIDTVHYWGQRGYVPLLMANKEVDTKKFKDVCGVIKKDTYEGYFRECNLLAKILFAEVRVDVVVFAGDYIFPDPNLDAADIGLKFGEKLIHSVGQPCYERHEPCWSPWVGRAFWHSTYGGQGPFYFEYFQYAGGRELQEVAQKAGNFWETDVIHQHMRPARDDDYYRKHNTKEYRERDLAIFGRRKEEGFPDSYSNSKLLLPPNAGRIILPSEI